MSTRQVTDAKWCHSDRGADNFAGLNFSVAAILAPELPGTGLSIRPDGVRTPGISQVRRVEYHFDLEGRTSATQWRLNAASRQIPLNSRRTKSNFFTLRYVRPNGASICWCEILISAQKHLNIFPWTAGSIGNWSLRSVQRRFCDHWHSENCGQRIWQWVCDFIQQYVSCDHVIQSLIIQNLSITGHDQSV
jgi:hypothetical protein